MPRFEVRQSAKLNLTSYSDSGLALIGQCCEAAQVEAVRSSTVDVGLKPDLQKPRAVGWASARQTATRAMPSSARIF